MKQKRWAGIGAAAALGLALSVAVACVDDRQGFEKEGTFEGDDAAAEAPECKFQCTIDGRSVVNACTGEIVETCPDQLACGGARCQTPCGAAAADRSSNGCDFYFQMPRFSKLFPQSCFAAFIVNTTSQPAEIKLELKGSEMDVSNALFSTTADGAVLTRQVGPVQPGASAILFLEDRKPDIPRGPLDNNGYVSCPDFAVPVVVDESALGGTMFGSSFHLTATMPVAVAMMYPIGGARSYLSSATMLLPVPTWANEHIIVNGWEAGGAGGPGVQIVASEDDTDVTIFPKKDVQDGADVKGTPEGVPATYRLGRGQLLQIVQPEELTGSVVTSTKPTSLFGGHSCANIPSNAGACDILGQQLPAFEQWGSEYVGVGYRPRLGNEHEPVPYRIVAARDGTQLDYDPAVPPGAPTTLAAGESALFHSGTGDAFVVRTQDAEHPIFLAAYMTGGDGDSVTGKGGYGSLGDPEFVNVVPAGQYLNAYSFYADPTYSETSLVIVRAKTKGEFKDVWLECAGNLADFQPIGTRGEYEYRRVDLSRNYGPGEKFGDKTCKTGVQRMRSEAPFTATLWGYDAYSSYAYPGGMAHRKLVVTGLDPVR